MQVSLFTVFVIVVLTAVAFMAGRQKAYAYIGEGRERLHSLPNYHGYFIAIWAGVPPLTLLVLYALIGSSVIDGLVVSRLEQAAAPLNTRFEEIVLTDQEMARLRQTPDGEVSARERSGQIEDRREELGANFLLSEEARDYTALQRAGFEYTYVSEARQDVMISDIRVLAYGTGVASRVTPELQAASELYGPYDVWFRWSINALALALAVGGLAYARSRVKPQFRARNSVERTISILLFLASAIAIATTIGIVLSLLFESLRFFISIDWRLHEFLFGLHWSPQIAIRSDQVGQSGVFGAVPLFAGTALITLIAMLVAVPIGLFAAIYLSEYADPKVRSIAKPVLEILAGVPTVVYGFFALLTVGPLIRDFVEFLGYENAVNKSALSAGLVMGVMIIPFVSSLSDDVINAVPQSLRDGAYALGATKSETVTQVILPAALPGLVGSILLAVSRAVGETMIVVMAAGQGANLTANPLESVTTITVQIVMLLTGDQEFDSPKTLSAFALGLILFFLTLALNYVALRVVQKYRERYE